MSESPRQFGYVPPNPLHCSQLGLVVGIAALLAGFVGFHWDQWGQKGGELFVLSLAAGGLGGYGVWEYACVLDKSTQPCALIPKESGACAHSFFFGVPAFSGEMSTAQSFAYKEFWKEWSSGEPIVRCIEFLEKPEPWEVSLGGLLCSLALVLVFLDRLPLPTLILVSLAWFSLAGTLIADWVFKRETQTALLVQTENYLTYVPSPWTNPETYSQVALRDVVRAVPCDGGGIVLETKERLVLLPVQANELLGRHVSTEGSRSER